MCVCLCGLVIENEVVFSAKRQNTFNFQKLLSCKISSTKKKERMSNTKKERMTF